MSLDSELLSQAIVIWAGLGETPWPAREESRLVDRLGADVAIAVLPRIRELEKEFYTSDARFVVAGLKEMGDRAAEQFKQTHPELSEEAIEALAWCYTFDYK
jgi:hypothetical protein